MSEPNASERPQIITVERFYQALVAADVLRAGERIRRIVIDAEVASGDSGHGVVRMYVERFGDERLLDVVPTLDGVEVHTGRPE